MSLASAPLKIDGTSGNDTIQVTANNGSLSDVLVLVNGKTTGPFRPLGRIEIHGGSGDDTIEVSSNVVLPTIIDGGTGTDILRGGSGDDQFLALDGEADQIDGGLGHDQASIDSLDVISSIELVNPLPNTADNKMQHVKVMVVNFDPLLPEEGNQHLYEFFHWNDPRQLAAGYKSDLERDSGEAVQFDIVQWRDLNEIPAFTDGFRYTPEDYVQHRINNSGWHTTSSADFPRIVEEQQIAPLIDSGDVDEVWFFSDHYFAMPGESWMAGPGAFFINGPTYPEIATHRAFACMGFSYERGVAEMLHNTGHRTESTMNRIYGGWNLANPTTNWDRFSANNTQSNGVAGVGTTHWPANAEHDYDTINTRVVQSWADDYLNYPNMTGKTVPVSRDTWGKGTDPDYERSYQNWYFFHLPRAAGVNPDGKQNNWWKYLYNFDEYDASGQPLTPVAAARAEDVYATGASSYSFQVEYTSPNFFNASSIGSGDISVTGPNGYSALATLVHVTDVLDDTRIVATYQIAAPGKGWAENDRGKYFLQLRSGEVTDVAGNAVPAGIIGSFLVRSTDAAELGLTADSQLLLHLNQNLSDQAGETPLSSNGVSYVSGKVGDAALLGATGKIVFPQAGNINAGEGTVEFWINPSWNADGTTHVFFQVGDPYNDGMLLSIDGLNNLRFIQWGDERSTMVVEKDYERGVGFGAGDWVAGKWHHFAATWKASQEMSLYIDGQLVDSEVAVGIARFSRTDLTIGNKNDGSQPSQAAFDEFQISSRALSAGEIASDYSAGVSLQSVSIDPAAFGLLAGENRSFLAAATADNGQQIDVTEQVHWQSSAPAVLTVDSQGNATGVAGGSSLLTAQLAGLAGNSLVTVTAVASPVVLSVQFQSTAAAAGKTTHEVTVTYGGNAPLDPSSIGLGDLRLSGPTGFSTFPQLSSIQPGSTPNSLVATYQFTPPGGYWDASDDGDYSLEGKAFQVRDTSGIYALPNDSLAAFQIVVGQPFPWRNPRNTLDVDNDDTVAAIDVLTVINSINALGSRPLSAPIVRPATAPPFLDPTGDNYVAADDVIAIINYINSQPALINGEGEGTANATSSPAVLTDESAIDVALLWLLADWNQGQSSSSRTKR